MIGHLAYYVSENVTAFGGSMYFLYFNRIMNLLEISCMSGFIIKAPMNAYLCDTDLKRHLQLRVSEI